MHACLFDRYHFPGQGFVDGHIGGRSHDFVLIFVRGEFGRVQRGMLLQLMVVYHVNAVLA